MKCYFIISLIFFCFSSSFGQTKDKKDANKPTSAEVIQAVEDTIGVDIDEISTEDIESLKARALELQGVNSKDEILKSKSGNVSNTQETQQSNKVFIDEVKEATEKVEKLVETASEDLRNKAPKVDIFGFDYIQKREVQLFNSALDVKPPENYIIGPGDEINVNIWGYSDYNEVFIVEKEGYVQPRQVGRVYVKGLTVADATKVLLSKFDRVYDLQNSKFDIAINYSRVITVNVVGEVVNPGSYTFPAVNSAFNILAYIGGPSSIGTLRNIQIKRDGQIIDRLDVYQFLFYPEKQMDIFLQNNDYLFVPLSQKIVEIIGEVKRPGKYELLEMENFDDLLGFAAGYNPDAFTKVIQIQRYQDNKVFIIDINMDSLRKVGGVLPLMNGDQIRIRKIPHRIENYVSISGPVYLPGTYEWKEGIKVSDLINQAGGFIDEVYEDEAYITRQRKDFTRFTLKIDLREILKNPNGPEDITLEKQDEIELLAKTYFFDKYEVSIKGAVRNPRTFKMQDGMTVRDLIILSGGLEQFAYLERAFITRKNKFDNTISYISFMVDTSNNMASLDRFILKEYDEVQILSNLIFTNDKVVSINGSVRNPGIFELWKAFSLKDIILISGGLVPNVYLPRAFITRYNSDLSEELITVKLDTSNNMAALDTIFLQAKDEIRIFSNNDYFESFLIEVNGEVRDSKIIPFRNNMNLADAILICGGLNFSASNHRIEIARVANFDESVQNDVPIEIEIIYLDLTADLINDAEANSFLLKPFDQVFVRRTAGFEFQEKVFLKGEFKYPGSYVLQNKEEKLSDIIKRAGGLTQFAFLEGVTIKRGILSKGNIIMDMEKALRRPNSKFNYILKEGDVINAPRLQDLVSITGTIGYPYIDTDSVVHVAHFSNKRARFYIRNYAVGFKKNSFKRETYVLHANGLVSGTKTFFGIKFYPKVDKGSTIHVPEKVPKQKRIKGADKNVSVLKVMETFIATSTSALTLYLLIDRALQ